MCLPCMWSWTFSGRLFMSFVLAVAGLVVCGEMEVELGGFEGRREADDDGIRESPGRLSDPVGRLYCCL